MIKIYVLIFFLLPKILLSLTISDDGSISNSSETTSLKSDSSGDVFLLKNAGLAGEDTTLNIPGGSELGSKNLQNR